MPLTSPILTAGRAHFVRNSGYYLKSPFEKINSVVKLAKKKPILHADLIEGLRNDEYAAEYLSQIVRPAGIVSTRAGVIAKVKQNGLLAIQRLFLLDTNALEKSYPMFEKTKPDFIEVLPGIIPHMISEVYERTGIPICAGGLVRTAGDVERAIEAGAAAVTTSNRELWKHTGRDDRRMPASSPPATG
ncbi:glycerol-3-phosphate responsive antiterminator [Paenibacillus sp. cl123]|uniref:glycerol-3-phosphate responsive antiterminator n=1 Tax=unclassified Paenibacillus TaxID=185978 RepID=UPI0035266B1A